MLRLYVCENVPNNLILVMARSPHHAEMQLLATMKGRGWEKPDGWKPQWRHYDVSQPGAYVMEK